MPTRFQLMTISPLSGPPAAPGPRAYARAGLAAASLGATQGRARAASDGGGDRGLFDSEALRESLEEADVQFFFALAEQDSQKTIVSEFGTASPETPAPLVIKRSWGEFSLTDGAVVAGWLVCMAVFLTGLWQRTILLMREKSRADPIYYAGIALIAVGTLVLVGYFVVRVEGVRAAVRASLSPSDAHEYVKLIPGALTMKARRETPAVRRSANMLLELGAFVLFVTPCVDIGLMSNLVLADNAYLPFARYLKRLIVRAVFFGFLRHEANVGHCSHSRGIKGTVLFAEINGLSIHARIATVRNDEVRILLLAALVPHLT